jgi:hypothetical protein
VLRPDRVWFDNCSGNETQLLGTQLLAGGDLDLAAEDQSVAKTAVDGNVRQALSHFSVLHGD